MVHRKYCQPIWSESLLFWKRTFNRLFNSWSQCSTTSFAIIVLMSEMLLCPWGIQIYIYGYKHAHCTPTEVSHLHTLLLISLHEIFGDCNNCTSEVSSFFHFLPKDCTVNFTSLYLLIEIFLFLASKGISWKLGNSIFIFRLEIS